MPELASSFDDAWARFRALDGLRLPGDGADQEFAKGRAQALGFQVRVEDGAARRHIEQNAERLGEVPGVEPFPDWFWHITVKMAGFQVIKRTHDDDVLRQDVPKLVREAREIIRRSSAFEAQLGAPNAFASAAFVEVLDGGRLAELNRELLESVSDIARYPYDGEGYLPHVTIARFTSNEGLAELKAVLAELRKAGPGPAFAVRRVEFVKAWLHEEIPEFETLASYQLRAP